jgi:hypothetical protein
VPSEFLTNCVSGWCAAFLQPRAYIAAATIGGLAGRALCGNDAMLPRLDISFELDGVMSMWAFGGLIP